MSLLNETAVVVYFTTDFPDYVINLQHHGKHTLLHVIDFEKYLRILLFQGFWCPLLVADKTWTDPPYLLQAVLPDLLLCKTQIFPLIEKCLNHTTSSSHRGLVPLSFSDCDPSEGE